MNYRLATILAREDVKTDFTKVIDLNLVNPVSQMQILYESTGVGGGSADHHAARCVTKIELIDGSDVLYSLNGMEAQAVDWYHNLVEPANRPVYLGGNNAEMVFNMNFGRFLWDTELAFDPRRFKNPQLKITIDRGAGGVGSVAGFLTVFGQLFDEKEVSPTGFLMHKEVKNYGLGSATHEYTNLPTDFPYRKLFIAACKEDEQIKDLINTIKLSEDNDKRIPVNCTAEELLRSLVGAGRPYREVILMSAGAPTGNFYCTPQHMPHPLATSWEVANIDTAITTFGGWGGKGYLYCSNLVTGVCVSVDGYAPHSVMEIPFGIQSERSDWYDVTKLGNLQLDIHSITARTAADTVQICIQQERPY